MVEARLLHRGGLVMVCIVKARSAYQIWKACVCIAQSHGVRGFPPSQGGGLSYLDIFGVIFMINGKYKANMPILINPWQVLSGIFLLNPRCTRYAVEGGWDLPNKKTETGLLETIEGSSYHPSNSFLICQFSFIHSRRTSRPQILE